jgi:ribosomal protein S18 acetylase RimI-like enzyme
MHGGAQTTGQIAIARGGPERITDLRALWESLHEHNAVIATQLIELGPVRSPENSWALRRNRYARWLSEPDAFVLLAKGPSRPVGYALVHMRGAEETWATDERIARLETLAVLPAYRGRGIGSALVDAVYRELRALDVRQLDVSVIAYNSDAVRFFERLGLARHQVSYLGTIPA